MGHGREKGRWFKLAHELAETGRYRNFAEVQYALKSREPDASLPADKVSRGLIEGTCFRVQRKKGWDT